MKKLAAIREIMKTIVAGFLFHFDTSKNKIHKFFKKNCCTFHKKNLFLIICKNPLDFFVPMLYNNFYETQHIVLG